MTGTTQISISNELYDRAALYARQHHTSVEKMTEHFFVNFLTRKRQENKMVRPTKFAPELLGLVGIAKGTERPGDINGDEARWECLKEKYGL